MQKLYNGKLYDTNNMKLLGKYEGCSKEKIIEFYLANDSTYWRYYHDVTGRLFGIPLCVENSFDCLDEDSFKRRFLDELGVERFQKAFNLDVV
jgi:hypothetical protein